MILYLFATLVEKRNQLIDKLNSCSEKSFELLFKIRQIDLEILNKIALYSDGNPFVTEQEEPLYSIPYTPVWRMFADKKLMLPTSGYSYT